jgi:4-hydroxybenzoate polyprenyltransferase
MPENPPPDSNDERRWRMDLRHNFTVLHDKAILVITAVSTLVSIVLSRFRGFNSHIELLWAGWACAAAAVVLAVVSLLKNERICERELDAIIHARKAGQPLPSEKIHRTLATVALCLQILLKPSLTFLDGMYG